MMRNSLYWPLVTSIKSILKAGRMTLCSGCSPTNSGGSRPYRCCRPASSLRSLPIVNSPAGTAACGAVSAGPAGASAVGAAWLLFWLQPPSTNTAPLSNNVSDLCSVARRAPTCELFFPDVFGAAKTECVIVHLQREKRTIVYWSGDPAFIKRAVDPCAALELLVVLAVFFGSSLVAVVGLVPRRGPLPDIARHIVFPVGTHSFFEGTHRRSVAFLADAAPALRRDGAVDGEVVAPRIGAAVGAARGLFPFLIGRQPLPGPLTVLFRVIPGDECHWMVGLALRIGAVAKMLGRYAAGVVDEFLILMIGHFVLVEEEGAERLYVLRPFSGQALIGAHGEFAGGNGHHLVGLGAAQALVVILRITHADGRRHRLLRRGFRLFRL